MSLPSFLPLTSFSSQYKKNLPGLYASFVAMPTHDAKVLDQITLDLHRTFPTHVQFFGEGGSGQQALARVLSAYSKYNTHLGYCQGMNFITAMFLMMMEEVSGGEGKGKRVDFFRMILIAIIFFQKV